MAATVRDTVTQLLESTRDVIDQLLALPIDEIPMPSSHTCAQGKDLWALVTNDIDHETIHAGQILEARRARVPRVEHQLEQLRAVDRHITQLEVALDEFVAVEGVPGDVKSEVSTFRNASHRLSLIHI